MQTLDTAAELPVTPSVVRAARARVNLSISEATANLNKILARENAEPIFEEDVQAWESGDARPTDVQTDALARIYLIPLVDLFQPAPLPPEIVDYRLGTSGRQLPLSYDTLKKLNRFERLYLVAKRVSQAMGLSEDISLPRFTRRAEETPEDFESIAGEIREHFGITNERQRGWTNQQQALSSWRQAIESAGAFVFHLPMPPEECRAASKWETGGPPSILVSSLDSQAAQLFSLAHELSHLVFRGTDSTVVCEPPFALDEAEERTANRLAGAILVPWTLIEADIPARAADNYATWSAELRSRLKQLTRVSDAVLGIRLQQLGVVKDSGYRSTWHKKSKGRGKSKPVRERFERYLGQRAIALAKAAVRSERISPSELALILDIKLRHAEALVV